MNLPLGITLTLLLILQTFQQVSTQIPDEWKRDNMAMDINQTQSSSEKPSVSIGESVETSGAKPEGSSEDGDSFGSFILTKVDEQKQNSTTLYQIPDHMDNDTEETSSGEPIATTPPPMIALNSSSDPSESAAESTTETETTATNTSTSEPEHTNQSALNDTYTSPKSEMNTTESSFDESGSGYFPPDDVPSNSTTKSPATTTKDESVQYKTTVSPTEPPVYRTTTPEIPPAIPGNITTPAPDSVNTGADLTGPFDNKDNSERGLSSDVTDATENRKGQAWAIVLVVGIVVGIIALAAFIILNRRNRRDFSHRKLVEETSPDPVLRLDNSEPLDLKFDGFGYYNPGLQGDNIQMTNFPQGRTQ
ncbi:Mucin-15 [Anabarilius grahami]|uniref:Mucin-15 n=1 Tax=Anabarilius grahami TaxID=495550 RepID=A0A3N0Z2P7_ANAGA|nr:Mucin-15 [Anabarilius grahami]